MIGFAAVLTAIVVGWVIYEYLSPWGTNAKLREMENKDE